MISDPILLAYLDESLTSDKMAELEAAIRTDEAMRQRLAELISRRESGVHSVGDIWRRNR
jgi:anti-sigma factor RsiW